MPLKLANIVQEKWQSKVTTPILYLLSRVDIMSMSLSLLSIQVLISFT